MQALPVLDRHPQPGITDDRTFHDWAFRSMIGPAQVSGAVQGCDQDAREQWKRDLENRKRYTREQRERARTVS